MYSCVFQPIQDGFEGNPEWKPLGICMWPHFENLRLDTFRVFQVDVQKFAFWDNQHPLVILDLAQHKKDTTPPAFYKSKLDAGMKTMKQSTDGSTDEDRAGAAAYTDAETLFDFQMGQLYSLLK